MKLANPELSVVVFSGDGDLFAIGGNHFLHAARRNIDITVICVNNFNYGMTGGQAAATTPNNAQELRQRPSAIRSSHSICRFWHMLPGATYIARWTMLHTRDLTKSIEEALQRRGFSFIEVLAPCPTGYGRRNRQKPIESLRIYQDRAIVKNGAHPAEVVLDFDQGITLGKFIDVDRPTFTEAYDKICRPGLSGEA